MMMMMMIVDSVSCLLSWMVKVFWLRVVFMIVALCCVFKACGFEQRRMISVKVEF